MVQAPGDGVYLYRRCKDGVPQTNPAIWKSVSMDNFRLSPLNN